MIRLFAIFICEVFSSNMNVYVICRFKTAAELVSSELREAGDCLVEGSMKLQLAIEELQVSIQSENGDDTSKQEKMKAILPVVGNSIGPMKACGESLERAGAAIVRRLTAADVGENLERSAENMLTLATLIEEISNLCNDDENALLSSQRLTFGSMKMKEAGNNLTGKNQNQKPKGKAWLKGGLQ